MGKKRILKAIVFFAIGIFLLWLVFRGTDLSDLDKELDRINWYWVSISVFLNTLSQYIRARRWRTLFKPLNYSPKTFNLFLSILILAFTNQVVPRGGEVARLGVINRYEKIPLAKLFGTALIERLTDLVILLLIFIALVAWQFPMLMKIIELPEISLKNVSYTRIATVITLSIIGLVIVYFILKRFSFFKRLKNKIAHVKSEVKEGFTSIYHIKHKFRYITQSILIYVIWLLMLYVLCFAYPPTETLSFKSAAFTFGLATMSFLLPIQSGMGAWHFLVIQSLLLFGVDQESGKAFALMAHAATNLVYVPLGAIAFALLPIFNNLKRKE